MHLVLSGRREEPLRALADSIGDWAWVEPLNFYFSPHGVEVGTAAEMEFG